MSNVDLKDVMAKAKAKVESLKAEALVRRQINAMSNDTLLQAKANMEIKQEDIAKVQRLGEQCKAIVETIELYDSRKKQVRKWSNSANYSYDILTSTVSNLLANVQYSNPQHKELMLEIVNVPEVLINEFNRVMNSNSRYSPLQDQIIVGQAGKEEEVKQIVQLVGEYLGIEFDLNQFNQNKLNQIEQLAMLRAEKDKASHEEAKVLHQQSLSL